MSHNGHAVPADSSDRRAGLLGRRSLLGRGAILAGAAGVATVAFGAPQTAAAADGDNLTLGNDNNAESNTTGLSINAPVGSASPTLELRNASGPTLGLTALPADFNGALELGQIANTELGPIIGVDSELGLTTTFLATGIDLADLPTPYPLPKPARLLDTRTSAGRQRILASSPNAFDPTGRLKASAWADVEAVAVTGEFETPGVWINTTAATPIGAGYLTIYPPGDYPGTSTVNYTKGVSIANGAFVATEIVAGRYAVRVRAAVTATHVVLDLTGLLIKGSAPEAQSGVMAPQSTAAARKKLTRRLRSVLTERVRAAVTR